LNLFITHLFQAGFAEWVSLIQTGHVERPDTLMVPVGGIRHFLLILGCLAAFFGLRPGGKQWLQFFGGGALAVAYMALIIVIAAPH
jgi:hypothetical protein